MSTLSNPISKKLHTIKLSQLVEGQKIVTVKATDALYAVVKVSPYVPYLSLIESDIDKVSAFDCFRPFSRSCLKPQIIYLYLNIISY